MVIIGVDSHKRTHTLAAVDELGRKLAERTLPATTEGYLDAPERGWLWAAGILPGALSLTCWQKAETSMRLLAECFEEIGGVPKVVLPDRMGFLMGEVVANVMVPTPDYVRLRTQFGFQPTSVRRPIPSPRGWSKGSVAMCRPTSSSPPPLADEVNINAELGRPSPNATQNRFSKL